jgi:hypothetical protein
LSHKDFSDWLRIAFIGVSAVPLGDALGFSAIAAQGKLWVRHRTMIGRRPSADRARVQFVVMSGEEQRDMDARTFDKSKLPSRHVTEGPARAPHRSYYYAMGLTEEEIHRPFVGVVSCWNEAAPCNIALMRQAQSAKKGVSEAGGTPREFCTITVTDGIAMGHQGMKSSLVSREVIADSIELTMRGHCYRRCSCTAARSCPASSRGKT